MNRKNEWAKFAARPDLKVEALHARYVFHRYERHSHDYFVLGTVEAGAAEVGLGRTRVVAPESTAMIINPGEAHDGVALDDHGYIYRMLYVETQLVRSVADDLSLPQGDIEFVKPVLSDAHAVRKLEIIHRSIMAGDDDLGTEVALLSALVVMLERYASSANVAPRGGRLDDRSLLPALELIHDCYDQKITTKRLAEVAGVSRVHLNKLFNDALGLPIHAYVNRVRMSRARALLKDREPPARVAVDVGLDDQSHLNRRFKGTFGVTPGQYSSAFNNCPRPRING